MAKGKGSEHCYDMVIVGGGPVGLFGAYYAGLRDMSVRLLESSVQLGGQVTHIYPMKWVFDVPGIPQVRGRDLHENLLKQIEPFEIHIDFEKEVVGYSQNVNKIIHLSCRDGSTYLTKTVLLAMGIGARTPRTLDLPDLDRMAGKGVHYAVKDLNEFQGTRTLVVGGGDTALDLALNIVEVAKQVTLIHRSDQFDGHEVTVQQVYASPVEVLTNFELKGVAGNERLQEVLIVNNCTLEERHLEVDNILISIGTLFNWQYLAEWGLALDQNAVRVDEFMRTNLPGVYAAGDIAAYAGKLKLIGPGASETMKAVNHAKRYIREHFPYL